MSLNLCRLAEEKKRHPAGTLLLWLLPTVKCPLPAPNSISTSVCSARQSASVVIAAQSAVVAQVPVVMRE